MRSDATEAALGLLGLNGNIDFRTTTTIPLKRKSSTSFSLPPPHDEPSNSTSSDSISCICGFTYDDGFSVACDVCSRWVHAACFDIVSGEVPEEWRCWICEPRRVDTEKAVRLQKMRQKQMLELEGERHKRRVSSPGVDRKRRVASAIDGSSNAKRKRRYSVNNPQQHQQVQQTNGEEEHIDIDEPSTHSYVHIDKDIIPHQHTRDKLKRLAQHWRGITALNSPDDLVTTPVMLAPDDFAIPQQTSLHPLPKSSYSHPTLSSNINPSVRPPSYTVRTTQPIPSSALIAPYTSTIIPSTVYLSDPLNSYAHLGMPKPFVHLIGPPLDVALDARLSGNGSRFVRSGCRPNAVLRPVLCRLPHTAGGSSPDETLTFGVFALRDLKAQEEVVLGWEWDDGSVIHHLPALIDSPHMFAYVRCPDALDSTSNIPPLQPFTL
ncbi:hypothetical protein PHLCEN_2v7905 [Hermanssonia centrifuga]|uniref:PHD-type domain-containing protein n=1 Tax=Hermanssonia centrifuga TaxID=98765 RepID=A0A2R6NVI4_9APHY|nr:hypothetical protein PHLCEN_2v7905 [Hermanssonia centrifuga]